MKIVFIIQNIQIKYEDKNGTQFSNFHPFKSPTHTPTPTNIPIENSCNHRKGYINIRTNIIMAIVVLLPLMHNSINSPFGIVAFPGNNHGLLGQWIPVYTSSRQFSSKKYWFVEPMVWVWVGCRTYTHCKCQPLINYYLWS